MSAPVEPTDPPLGMKSRHVYQYRKGVDWAIRAFEKAESCGYSDTPDNAYASAVHSIKRGVKFPVLRHLCQTGGITDGPPQYRVAHRLFGIAKGKKDRPKDSLDRSFWRGVVDVCNSVTGWWNDNSDLIAAHYGDVEEKLLDMFNEA